MLGGILTALACVVASRQSWHLAEVISLAIALPGCLFGTWVGSVWLGGWQARLWLLPKIALLAFSVAHCCVAVLGMLVDRTPLPFEPPNVTSADKRESVKLAPSQRPRSVQKGQTRTMELTERHINLLFAWGLRINLALRFLAMP